METDANGRSAKNVTHKLMNRLGTYLFEYIPLFSILIRRSSGSATLLEKISAHARRNFFHLFFLVRSTQVRPFALARRPCSKKFRRMRAEICFIFFFSGSVAPGSAILALRHRFRRRFRSKIERYVPSRTITTFRPKASENV